MNHKTLAVVCGVALLVAGSIAFAQANKPAGEIEKVIEQNEKILQKQEDILKQLGEIKQDIAVLRRALLSIAKQADALEYELTRKDII